MRDQLLFDSKSRLRWSVSLCLFVLTGLLMACGDSGTTAPTTTQPTTTQSVTTTTLAGTSSTTAPVATTAVTTTQAVTTGLATTQTAPTATVVPATTTQATPTTVITTQAATPTPAPTATRQPVGNTYPAGPAPTAAPPEGGLVEVPLDVPTQFKNNHFSLARTLKMPVGFHISVYSQLDGELRFGTFSPDGRLFLSERSGGRVAAIKDNGTTGEPFTWADGLNGPHGLAFHRTADGKTYLYVAENDKVTRFNYENGQPKAGTKEVIVKSLPTGGNHTTRSIAFGPDGKMYIAAGSTCNVCEETDPRRAAVSQFNEDGTGERLFATGLRNEVGIRFNPETGEFWGVENSRDNAGSNQDETNRIPPEEVNILQDQGFYGWPYCYSNQVYDAQFGRKNADICKQSVPPALPMEAHSAPLGFDFYYPAKSQQFPADFKGDVFVAFHGSWNRSPATGYKVVRVRVKDGRPVSYEDFATGWLTGSSNSWGRPVDVITAPDGSLFVTDDVTNALYHITYSK